VVFVPVVNTVVNKIVMVVVVVEVEDMVVVVVDTGKGLCGL